MNDELIVAVICEVCPASLENDDGITESESQKWHLKHQLVCPKRPRPGPGTSVAA